MDSKKYISLIQQTYVCPSVKSHRYYSASQFVTQHPRVKVLVLHFPFKKYGTSMYTVDITKYIFTQIMRGVNFFPIVVNIASMHHGLYIKDAGDVNVANFDNTINLHFQLFSMISGMSFVVPQNYQASQNQQIEKLIDGHGELDNKFIKNYKKLVIVLNEEDTVVSWELIDFNLQDKIEPVLNDASFKLKNNQITDIYTDTLCRFKNVYKQCFSKVLIKLDLFPAIE